jgi:hypothetical protein
VIFVRVLLLFLNWYYLAQKSMVGVQVDKIYSIRLWFAVTDELSVACVAALQLYKQSSTKPIYLAYHVLQ